MKNPLHSEKSTSLGLLLARVPVGVQFVIDGCNTITSESGLGSYVSSNAGLLPPWMSEPIGQAIFYAVPFIQVVGGLALVLGFFSRLAGFLLSLILIGFMVLRGMSFTTAHVPQNVVFLGVTLMVMLAGSGTIGLDSMIWGKSAAAGAGGSSKKSSSD